MATIGLEQGLVVGFYTHLDFSGMGIGSEILKFIEDYAKDLGLKKIRLASSPQAFPFYVKKGWLKLEDALVYYQNVAFEETLMEKTLC